MTGIKNNLALTHERKFLFELEPFFAADSIDLYDERYLADRPHTKYTDIYHVYKYHNILNPYLENEVKGFVRHLVIDKGHAPSYIKDFLTGFISNFTHFMNEVHPDCNTVVEYDYEYIFNDYCKYVTKCGYTLVYQRTLPQTTENMEWMEGPVTSMYVLGFGQYYRYIDSIVYPDTTPERQKDIWDVRNLGVPFSTLPSRPRYTINYQSITQKWLKEQVKDYNFYRIQHREMSSVLDDMKAFNLLSAFLSDKHLEIRSMRDFNREIAEEYISYVGQKGFVASTFNRRISAIRTFLLVGNILEMDDFPTKPIFTNSDYVKVVHKNPIPFSDGELRQMNEHIQDLPIMCGRILFILENCGMRLSDLVSSEIKYGVQPCLKPSGKGYIFTYMQPKVHRTNTIPVSTLVAEVIKNAIEDAQEQYGQECKYIFARSIDECICEEVFTRNMNNMSKRHGLVTDLGKPLRIKGHTFRKTKATEYANMGVTLDVIRAMLGQRKLNALKHYITIHSASMIDAMKNITEQDDEMIRNIGHIQESIINENTEEGLLPLSNGYCTKNAASGLCSHAYACYECRMYRPSKEFLPIYKAQLRETLNNIEIAKLNGYERLLQVNEELRDNLNRIISRIEE